jgi:hypothetical protein
VKLANWFLPRLATFGAGLLIKKTLDYAFDYLLYPAALIVLGYMWGGIAMTIASVALNLLVIRAYDWAKRDFLLLEALKGLRSPDSTHAAKRLLAKVLGKGDFAAFLVLSWIEDPIVVTLYLRKGSGKFDGLSRRDWAIFWASTLVSNLMWAGSLISLIEVYRLLR